MKTRISLLTTAALLCFAASAEAQTTIGQLPTGPTLTCVSPSGYDEVQTAVSSGSSYVVPAPGGVITSWSTKASATTTQMLGLKVFRPVETKKFLVVAHDGPRALTPSTVNTFPVDIPVQAGDIVGLNVPINAGSGCAFPVSAPGNSVAYLEGGAADGTVFLPEEEEEGYRLNITATVLAPPTITTISPASGSIKGGTSVAITGTNLAELKSVSFGAVPATSFTVNSETQVTAIAPPSAKVSKQTVGLTTAAGTASSPLTFAYTGCVVPKLGGKKLKAAKKKLKKADCKLGKVKKLEGATSKTGKVKSQSPKQGKVLAPGSKVNLKLGL
jgi:IPT/TIG domain/PASTA domain